MILRIGNAQGFWGDRPDAAAQMLRQQPDLHFLTLDYLAELSLSIMAIQREKDPSLGYAKDFLRVIERLIPMWKEGNPCRVVTNAGGLNPVGCGHACSHLIEKAGLSLRIGIVTGDDVLSQVDPSFVTANAYLGAKPVADALKKGAHIVITGRTADPSLTVGPFMAHFQCANTEYDRIAQATIAGHLIECGTQVTGSISGSWLQLRDQGRIGFPFVEIAADGSFVVTKPKGTSGEVSLNTVKEQLLYEIGDPGAYLSPDATVSFLTLQLTQAGIDRVKVSGATGKAPPATLKVSACYRAGFRAEGMLTIVGAEAYSKARASAQAIRERLQDRGLCPQQWHVECLGAENETVMRIAVADQGKEALEAFSEEIAPLVTAGAPGTTGYTSGRPKIRPIFGYKPLYIDAKKVSPKVMFLQV